MDLRRLFRARRARVEVVTASLRDSPAGGLRPRGGAAAAGLRHGAWRRKKHAASLIQSARPCMTPRPPARVGGQCRGHPSDVRRGDRSRSKRSRNPSRRPPLWSRRTGVSREKRVSSEGDGGRSVRRRRLLPQRWPKPTLSSPRPLAANARVVAAAAAADGSLARGATAGARPYSKCAHTAPVGSPGPRPR